MKHSAYAFVFLALFASGVKAEELLLNCQFEATKVSSGDPNAKAWLDDLAFRTRKFVIQTDPSKILDGPGSDAFWGEPRIKVGTEQLEFEWRVKAKPIDRKPVIALSINRFSGKALESYSMLKEPNQGPLLVHWARTGRCEIHKKKL